MLAGQSGANVDSADPSLDSRVVEVSLDMGPGEDKEVSVLLDDSDLKLATVTLRKGTTLPAHRTAVPATIQIIEGNGIIHVSGRALEVSAGTIVVVAADAEHDVVPAPDTDMLLLVHYLRGDGAGSPPAHDH